MTVTYFPPRSYKKPLPFFVYGTLRPGGGLHDFYMRGMYRSDYPAWLSGAEMTATGTPGIPYVYQVNDLKQTVRGNLFDIWATEYDDLLYSLDQLEGYSEGSLHNHYWRRKVVVDSTDGQVEAWCYLAQRSTALATGNVKIPGGNYLRYANQCRLDALEASFKVREEARS